MKVVNAEQIASEASGHERFPHKLNREGVVAASVILERQINAATGALTPLSSQAFKDRAFDLQRTIKDIDALNEKNAYIADYIAYYGLLTRSSLAAETIVAPIVFAHPTGEVIDSSLSERIAATTNNLLGDALAHYDEEASIKRRGHLAGVIGELTFLSLTNHGEAKRIGIVASRGEDLHSRTDAHILYRGVDSIGYQVPVQVKAGLGRSAPLNGFNINGEDMSNLSDAGFPISRILAATTCTIQESSTLEQSRNKLEEIIALNTIKNPGVTVRR